MSEDAGEILTLKLYTGPPMAIVDVILIDGQRVELWGLREEQPTDTPGSRSPSQPDAPS